MPTLGHPSKSRALGISRKGINGMTIQGRQRIRLVWAALLLAGIVLGIIYTGASL